MFDVVGQFGRSLDDIHHIPFTHIREYPSQLLWIFFKNSLSLCPLANAKQQVLTEEFIGILEDFLGVKRTPFSFAEEWEKNPPKKAGSVSLSKYTEKVCFSNFHS